MNMKTQAIIPAAGIGERFRSSTAKVLVSLNGRPLIVHTCEVFQKCPLVDSVILVVSPDIEGPVKKLIADYGLTKVKRIVHGGKTRSISVFNGLKQLDEDTKLVVIHDGARPLVSQALVEESIKSCYDEAAVIAAVAVKPTIKRVNPEDHYVETTLNRRMLWEVQTPQVFRKDVILRAHTEILDTEATDDAFLVEQLGEKVKVVQGDYRNIKITTSEDILIAEAFLTHRQGTKISP